MRSLIPSWFRLTANRNPPSIPPHHSSSDSDTDVAVADSPYGMDAPPMNYEEAQAAAVEQQIKEGLASGKLAHTEESRLVALKDAELEQEYEGRYVAYHDLWENGVLERIVIAHGETQAQMRAVLNASNNKKRRPGLQVHIRSV